MKKFLCVITLIVIMLTSLSRADDEKTALVEGGNLVLPGGTITSLRLNPFYYDADINRLYFPMEEVLSSLGGIMGWDNELKATVCVKGGVKSYVFPDRCNIWVGENQYFFDLPPMKISGVTYISASMLDRITGYDISLSGTVKEYKKRDTLENTVKSDDFRLFGTPVSSGGVSVFGNFGMELVSLSPKNGVSYANVINAVAETLPNVNVYNILVPTAAEFYAPTKYYPKQLAGMKAAYEALSYKVTPVNVYDTLKNHAGEKIYFSTDHHWTQRGAYYAYKAFIEQKGKSIDPLDSFQNVPSSNHVGSLARFAGNNTAGNIMRSNPELLERFLPKFATVGTVFADQNQERVLGVVKAVNTDSNAYSCFIGGDGPVAVFYTDAPSNDTIVIIKESFGNAFATWAMHNYKKVCVVDPRKFNGFDGNNERFNLREFCDSVGASDVVFINYPVAASSQSIRSSILKMA